MKHGKSHIIKGSIDKEGYCRVVLRCNGRKESWGLHQLTFTVWNRNISSNEDVHHINEVKTDNLITNLTAKSRSEHIREHKTGKKHS